MQKWPFYKQKIRVVSWGILVSLPLLAFVAPVQALAASNDSIYINPATSNVQTGSSTSVSLMGNVPTGNSAIGSWTFDVSYNPADLKVSGCTTNGGTSVCNPNYGSNVIRISGASGNGLSGSIDFADIKFQGTAAGTSSLQITPVTLTDVNANNITPTVTNGSIDVTGTSVTSAPTVSSIAPSSGSAAGGTTVTINGSNFTSGSTVSFGSTPATNVTVVSSTQITAQAPAGTAGNTVDVTVTNSTGTSSTSSADQFTYNSASASSTVSVSPSSTTVAPGGTASIAVTASAPAAGIGSWEVEVLYNPADVSVSSCTALPSGGATCNPTYHNQGVVYIAGMDVNGLSGNATLANIKFQASSSASGTIPLTVKVLQFTDPSGAAINSQTSNGAIVVQAPSSSGGSAPSSGGSSVPPSGSSAPAGGGGFVMPSSSTNTGIGASGGLLKTADGLFSMNIPSGQLSGSNTLSVSETSLPSNCTLSAYEHVIGPVFPLTGTSLQTPQVATIKYSASALQGGSTNRLGLFQVGSNCSLTPVAMARSTSSSSVQAYVGGPETLVLIYNDQQFSDLPSGYWANKDIEQLVATGAINGLPGGTFGPNQSVTRAQFVKMIDIIKGVSIGSGSTSFTDVPSSAWFAPYVAAAVKAGWVNGTTATTFAPNAYITREQMAVMLARAFNLPASTATLPFLDTNMINSWALPGVESTVADHLMTGLPGNLFGPLKNATRAQAAAVLARAFAQSAPQ